MSPRATMSTGGDEWSNALVELLMHPFSDRHVIVQLIAALCMLSGGSLWVQVVVPGLPGFFAVLGLLVGALPFGIGVGLFASGMATVSLRLLGGERWVELGIGHQFCAVWMVALPTVTVALLILMLA